MHDSAIPFGDLDHALTNGRLRPLWLRCAFGDRLAFDHGEGDSHWYWPAGQHADPEEGGLTCVYQHREDGARLYVKLGRHRLLTADLIAELRESQSPRAAERKWAAFAGRMGSVQAANPRAPLWVSEPLDGRFGVIAAERLAHPSAYIDRLMMRDRMAAGQLLIERLLGISSSPPASLAPSEPPHLKQESP